MAAYIIGAIFLIIFLINMIRVGVDAEYVEETFYLSVRISGIPIHILPNNRETKKKKSKRKRKNTEPVKTDIEEKQEKKSRLSDLKFSKDEIVEIIRVILKSVNIFRKKLRVSVFKFWFVSSNSDPFSTISLYNYVNDAICVLGPIADATLNVKKSDIRTATDFQVGRPFVEARILLSIRIGQVVWIGINAGIKAIIILKKHKKKMKQTTNSAQPGVQRA